MAPPQKRKLLINGRFASQQVTGVQRCAWELLHGIDRWLATDTGLAATLEVIVLLPRDALWDDQKFEVVTARRCGRLRGHAWEQLELPLYARGCRLLNLCNTYPILASRPTVIFHDAAVFARPQGYTRAFVLWYRSLMRVARWRSSIQIATVSQFSKQELAGLGRLPAERIAVIPNGIDHWQAVEPNWEVLERLGLRRGEYLLAVGSQNPNKNTGALLQAFQQLDRTDLQLVLVGAANKAVFGHVGWQNQYGERLVWAGYVDDAALAALYSGAACFVFPSIYEGFGFPPLEAMYFGCPVVCSRAASLPEVVGDAALLCEPQRPEFIAEAIRTVLDETGRRERMSRLGREWVRRYRWRTSAQALMTLVDHGR